MLRNVSASDFETLTNILIKYEEKSTQPSEHGRRVSSALLPPLLLIRGAIISGIAVSSDPTISQLSLSEDVADGTTSTTAGWQSTLVSEG